jgi:adenosine deaminase
LGFLAFAFDLLRAIPWFKSRYDGQNKGAGMRNGLIWIALVLLVSCAPALTSDQTSQGGASGRFEQIKEQEFALREFLHFMPKGGELHNHLYGAVFAESWIRWAREDGLCLDTDALELRLPKAAGCGALPTAKTALAGDQGLRNRLIDKLSVRDFVPDNGWSGHDQFFDTFMSIAVRPERFGDMVAEAANEAGRENLSYVELMHTLALFERIYPLVADLEMSGDAAADYEVLMASEFGKQLPDIVAAVRGETDRAMARKDELLGCSTPDPEPGCGVEIRFLSQNVRTIPLAVVYAHAIFGWELVRQDPRFVGSNLVAPEDDFIALRDYQDQMEQLDFLYQKRGPQPVSLHAGELWQGLVHPDALRLHIRQAIELGHATRIGHGTDIGFEDAYQPLLEQMREKGILVEISLSSSDVVLGVRGDAHPFALYLAAGVPVSLSTDDAGVLRIDITDEFVRAVQEFDLDYAQVKALAYNGLRYAFVDEATKQRLLQELDQRFVDFESGFE